MAHGADDDFQFLDIGGIAGLGDGLRFDFPELQNATGGSSLGFHHQHPQDSSLDTPMAGTDAGSATSHASIPTHMVAGPPPTAADAIVEIDAQIQYLQQQRLQQQQRQLEEQYYVRQARMVPPTPQSLELQPGNAQFYGQSDPSGSQSHTHQQQQQHQQAVFERFPRLKDQQDVSNVGLQDVQGRARTCN